MIGAAFCLALAAALVRSVQRAISRHDDDLLADEFARLLAEAGL